MKTRLLITAALTALAAPAFGQTVLTIAATGQAQAEPDEAVASLTVQQSAGNAAVAQLQVNAAMAAALALARAVPGLQASTGGYNAYSTQPDDNQPLRYTAQQQLTLVMPAAGGIPSAAFSAMLGRMQQNGLLLNTLEGDLSSDGQNQATQAAIADALGQIQSQAGAAAAQLHETVGTVKTLTINASPAPVATPMLAMAVRDSAAPPQSAPGKATVTASVTAQVELNPPAP